MARVGNVPDAGELNELGPRELGERAAALVRLAVVAIAVDDEHGAAHLPADLLDLLPRRGDRFGVVHEQCLDRAVEPVGDCVLDVLGRVGLREHLAEEELEEAPMVAAHVVAVVLLPALGPVSFSSNDSSAAALNGWGGVISGMPGASATIPSTRSGCVAASWTEGQTPSPQMPARTAASVDVASITARQSDAYQPSSHGPDGSGMSELPLPRPS